MERNILKKKSRVVLVYIFGTFWYDNPFVFVALTEIYKQTEIDVLDLINN